MTGPAVVTMLTAVVIIWGGLAISVTALWVRGRREEAEAKAEAARAAQHSAEPSEASER